MINEYFHMKKLLNKNIFILSIFALIFYSFTGKSQQVFTLEEALKTGLENNFGIRIERSQAAIAKNNNTIGNAGFLPVLSADGSYMERIEDVNQKFLTGQEQERKGAKTNTFGAGVELRWTVFDGFRMFAAKDRLDALDEAAEYNYRNQVETSAANIITTYYDIVQQQQLLKVMEEGVKISMVRRDLGKTRYEIGSASKIEYLQAKVDLNADSSALLRQIASLRKAKMDLFNTIGKKDGNITADFAVTDTITLLPVMQLAELQSQAEKENSRLLVAEKTRQAIQSSISEARSILYPQLDLTGRYNFTDMQAQAGFLTANQVQGFNYGATARWMLFPGQNPARQIQNAKIASDIARLTYDEIKLDINTQIAKAYEDYSNNITIVNLEKDNQQFAVQNLDIANERYKIGKINIVEFREAQVAYIQARTRLVTAVYNAKLSETQLLRLSGQLSKGANR